MLQECVSPTEIQQQKFEKDIQSMLDIGFDEDLCRDYLKFYNGHLGDAINGLLTECNVNPPFSSPSLPTIDHSPFDADASSLLTLPLSGTSSSSNAFQKKQNQKWI